MIKMSITFFSKLKYSFSQLLLYKSYITTRLCFGTKLLQISNARVHTNPTYAPNPPSESKKRKRRKKKDKEKAPRIYSIPGEQKSIGKIPEFQRSRKDEKGKRERGVCIGKRETFIVHHTNPISPLNPIFPWGLRVGPARLNHRPAGLYLVYSCITYGGTPKYNNNREEREGSAVIRKIDRNTPTERQLLGQRQQQKGLSTSASRLV